MKRLLSVLAIVLTLQAVQAQTASVQVIHNSADAAAATVDVYVDGSLAIPDFAFRTATPFINLTADVPITIDIAPGNSTDVGDSIYQLTTTLASGETYVIVADGIVSASGYSPAPAFDLEVYDMGQEAAGDPANTDVLVHHGSTDAPTVDIVEVGVGAGTIVDNLTYTDFQGYLPLPTADYALEVRDETGTVTVAAYEAPLATLGLGGEALVAVASGFLDPSVNSDGPAFGIFAALPAGGALVELPASTARVQVIHNSADAAAAEVDVYLNGDLAIDDFAFRTATTYLDFPAGVGIEVAIAPGNSTDVGDAIATFPFTLDRTETYQIVANGIVSGSGYDPAQPFTLDVLAGAREAAINASNVDVMVHHGSTDAPTVDVVETGAGAGTIVNDLSYTEFTPAYLELAEANYAIEVRDATGTVTVAAYELPLADLSLAGTAVTAVASGFLDPSLNSDGADFGVFVALPSGGDLVPLPNTSARVQIIHNSADAAASEVDVYVDDVLALDNFAFRTATPFIDLNAVVDVEVAIAPANSTGSGDAIATFNYNLERNRTYVIVANGIVSASGYDPAPAFDLDVFNLGRETANDPANTDVLVHHGSTDAPLVDIVEVAAGAGTIVNNMGYTDFKGYLELATANYAIEVRDDSGTVTVAAYELPLADLALDGAAVVAVASGFLDPSVNSDGPAFSVFVALPSGGALVELPTSVARAQIIHNSADALAEEVDVYLNGGLAFDDFAFRTATPFVDLPAGVLSSIAVAPGNSTSVNDAIATFDFGLERETTYVIVADGIVSPSGYDPAPPFGLEVYTLGREEASTATNTDVLVHHGSTDAPTVDIVETATGAGTIVDDLSYTDFQGYLELPTADYEIDVRDESGTTTVVSYQVPLSTLNLDGQAIVAVASGFLDPSNNSDGPAFGIWVALAAGGDLIPLPELLNTDVLQSDQLAIYPNPASQLLNVAGLKDDVQLLVVDMQGRIVIENNRFAPGQSLDVSSLSTGVYQLILQTGTNIQETFKIVKQ